MRCIALILAVLAFAAKLPPSKTLRIAQFPPYPQIGKPVLLFLDDPRSPTSCDWFQGRDPSQENHIFRGEFDPTAGIHRINRTGPAYTGREDLARRCALIVRKIQASDGGPYSVSVMGLDGSHPVTAVRNLQVPYSPFSFHVEAARMVQFPPNPRVGQSVFLYLDDIQNPSECSWFRGEEQWEEGRIFRAKFSQTSKSYLINLKGASFGGREEVWTACSLVIRKVKASDSGLYTVSMWEREDTLPITARRYLEVSP